MQPQSYPVQQDVLLQYWQSFMDSGKIDSATESLPDPAIIRSWQRCAPLFDPNVRPRPTSLNDKALATVLRSQSDLVSVALPYMEDIYQFIEGSDNAVLLTDGTGCVLTVCGDPQAVQTMNDHGLGQGSYWSEGYLGTNAVGLSLIIAMPTQVVGAEHYFRDYHHLVSSAAPIHDVKGRIIGTVGIVGLVKTATSHTVSLTMATARAIGNQLQTNLYLEEANRRLTEMNTILESIAEGVLAWDEENNITHINEQASRMFQLQPTRVLGQPLGSVLNLPTQIASAITANKGLHDVEVTFETNGLTLDTLVSLYPILHGKEKPVSYIALFRPIERVRRLVHQQVGSKAMLTLEDVSSMAPTMRPILRQARIAARGTAPVLLRGEGGVGKNHLARAIHNAGERAEQPFISINCRAIPRELIVSEFLGYEKGAEQNGRPSKFELANGGTLFLDHLDSLSLEMQSALLHVIETGHVMRIGSIRAIPVNVRIIASTVSDLEQAVADKNFLSHLYYRFGVFNISIPPLRERREDIQLLAGRFLSRITDNGRNEPWMDEEALTVLQRYPWPGNVRELEMVLERAIHHRQGEIIRLVDLPESVRNGRVVTHHSPHKPQPVLSIAEAEREAIIRAGWACQGNVTNMAQQLGIGRTTLWRKMKRLNISSDHFKQKQ